VENKKVDSEKEKKEIKEVKDEFEKEHIEESKIHTKDFQNQIKNEHYLTNNEEKYN